MELEFLRSLVLIFGISAIVIFILGRFKIPSIVGFLISGVILGPFGFKLINDVHEVEILAEIGVILLMFTIGLEFSFSNLMELRTQVLGGGFLQVLLTTVVITFLSFFFFNFELNMAIFDGFLVALSSTAIVTKLLMDRAEINTLHGRTALGVLIFQDLCVVPFMLLIPVLSGSGTGLDKVIFAMIKAFVFVSLVMFVARWAVPRILHEIVKTRSRELFVITIILLCIGTAFFTSKLGLSLALGAFMAGIVISESEYASQAISDILPFKESFTGLFFISVGMLMNIHFFITNIELIIIVVFAIFVLKTLIGAASLYISGQSFRISLQSGFYISQIGEFSFVLALAGKASGLITENIYQVFLSASVITMLVTPFIIIISPKVSEYIISNFPLRNFARMKKWKEKDIFPSRRSDHVIIIGFGINGSNLAKVLKESNISYVVLEMNPNTVKKMKKLGEPIYYGDGTSIEILHKMGILKARLLVVAISDAAATRRIVQIAKNENPKIHIIVRTRYVAEVDDLLKYGADEVIPEEFETSIEIFSRVLHHYHIPRNIITEHIENIRKDSYSALRSLELPKKHLAERHEFLKDIETDTYLIKKNSSLVGHTIEQLRLRTETGVTIIAVQSGSEIIQNPHPQLVLRDNNVLLLIGKRKDISNALEYLDTVRFSKNY